MSIAASEASDSFNSDCHRSDLKEMLKRKLGWNRAVRRMCVADGVKISMSNKQTTCPRYICQPFQKRAVAFLDILGFKNLISESESGNTHKLRSLVALLDSYIARDAGRSSTVPNEVKPDYLFVSDSIILSASIQDNQYDGLAIVTMKCIEIAQRLLFDGYIIRGAIDVGPVWHKEQNIFGSAYINAYQTEEAQEKPRIILCPSAKQHMEQVSARSLSCSGGLFSEDIDGSIIADTFQPAYLPDTYGDVEFVYRQFRAHIIRNIGNTYLPEGARLKWRCIAQTYNRAIQRYGISVAPISDAYTADS